MFFSSRPKGIEGRSRCFEVLGEFPHAPRGKREKSFALETPTREPLFYFSPFDSRVQGQSDEVGSGLSASGWGLALCSILPLAIFLDLTPQFVTKGELDVRLQLLSVSRSEHRRARALPTMICIAHIFQAIRPGLLVTEIKHDLG